MLRIVKAAVFLLLYESSGRYDQEGETEPDVRCTRYYILGGEISVGEDTVMEQEGIVLEASRNTLMARNAREICNFFAQLYLYNGYCSSNRDPDSIRIDPD